MGWMDGWYGWMGLMDGMGWRDGWDGFGWIGWMGWDGWMDGVDGWMDGMDRVLFDSKTRLPLPHGSSIARFCFWAEATASVGRSVVPWKTVYRVLVIRRNPVWGVKSMENGVPAACDSTKSGFWNQIHGKRCIGCL